MTKIYKRAMTSNQLLAAKEYKLVKQKQSNNFITAERMCQTFKVNHKISGNTMKDGLNLTEVLILFSLNLWLNYCAVRYYLSDRVNNKKFVVLLSQMSHNFR